MDLPLDFQEAIPAQRGGERVFANSPKIIDASNGKRYPTLAFRGAPWGPQDNSSILVIAMYALPVRSFVCVMGALVLCLLAGPGHAMDGKTLAEKVLNRDDGKDSYAMVRMLLVDKRGNKRLRKLISATKDFGDVSKSFMRFTEPASIEGTAFLIWENEDRDDDQFLYLPALRRVRRIVSNQKDSRFVNTDYTYEDMQTRKVEKDSHKILRSETVQGYDCWILESTPKDPGSSQYGKWVSWVSKDLFLPVKTEYYDQRGRLEKILFANDIQMVNGIATVMDSEMRNLQRKHRTFMKTDTIKYNTNIPDRIFTRRYLENPD